MIRENLPTLLGVAGGLGIFLLGMIVMTENLKQIGGNSMRSALRRFTRNPATGALTGAVCTAVLQSSSATTVAAVGFVGAGLLPFTNALGIIFGANIGTTITGWLVALLGFKMSLGSAATGFIFAGVMLRLIRPGKFGAWGMAIAGFGLIFIGISTMQGAMSGLEGQFTPSNFPPDTWLGRLELFAAGFLLTVVTQASSAGVALAMTALNEGTINFNQAAALVVGMDLGTTLTALLASIGTTSAAKRTGLSHVVYNCMTAIGALLLITPFVMAWEYLFHETQSFESAIGIAAFHTTFNTIGVLVILPVTRPFAWLMERLVPEPTSDDIGPLDRKLLEQPPLALIAAQQSLQKLAERLMAYLLAVLEHESTEHTSRLDSIRRADDTLTNYLDDIEMAKAGEDDIAKMRHLLHVNDHIGRLINRCEERDRIHHARGDATFAAHCQVLCESLPSLIESAISNDWQRVHQLTRELRDRMADPLDRERDIIIDGLSNDTIPFESGTHSLEVTRWFERTTDHLERIAHHLDTGINS